MGRLQVASLEGSMSEENGLMTREDDQTGCRGMLAAVVAACSAALQLASRSSFALLTASWAEVDDSCRRKTTKIRERIG